MAALAWAVFSPARAVAVQDFPLPTGDAGLIEATQGPTFGNKGIISWNDALVLAEEDANQLAFVNTKGQIDETPVPPSIGAPEYGPFALSTARNDEFWMLSDGAPLEGRVTRLTPDGVTFWNQGYDRVVSIAADPQGGAWVTYLYGEGISYFGQDGVEHFFDEPQYSDPSPVTVGGDGAAWFGDGSSTIKRITKAGNLQNFHASGDGSEITSITTGPDGAVWYAKFNPSYGFFGPPPSGGVIGRLSLGGSPKAFQPPVEDLLPSSLISGPDGALWFTTGLGKGIGRMTTSGRYTYTDLPGGRHADSIAFGPDGALWYTDSRLNRVGRITTAEFKRSTAPKRPKILSRKLKVRRGRSAKLRIGCPAGLHPCRGKIKVKAGRKLVGRGSYSLPTGRSRGFGVRITRAGKKLLRRRRAVSVKVKLKPANARAVTRKMKLRR